MPHAITCIDCRRPRPTSPCRECQAKRDAKRNAESYYQTIEWKRLRSRAARRWGRVCFLCGSTHRVTYHHLHAREEGGPDIVENLRPLCGNCHSQFEVDKRAGRDTVLTRLVGALKPAVF